jgi:tetratricopeptide (TPR) repeat protein
MKRLLLLLAIASAWPAAAQTTDPAKVAEFEKRFAQGMQLEQDGKLPEALAVFDGILAEEPKARGSLREAGRISVQQGDLAKADDYFSRLHELVPDYPEALEQLIQINTSLKRDIKVERLLKEFIDLHNSGKNPDFAASTDFIREKIRTGPDQGLFFTQFFDYTKDPHIAYMLEQIDSNQVKRQLLVAYNPDETAALRAKQPNLGQVEVFALMENIIAGDKIARVNAYKVFTGTPDYARARAMMLGALANPPTPIDSEAAPPESAAPAGAGAAPPPAPAGR